MANVHPWFADTTIDDAAAWTAEFFAETDVAAANALSNTPKMYIAETGWPTVCISLLFLRLKRILTYLPCDIELVKCRG